MALEGTLQDMSLLDLFEIFRMGNKSGILQVASPDQQCSIYVTMGRLIDAAVYDANTRQMIATGDVAIVQVLQWNTGEFSFTHDPLTIRHPVTIFHEVDQLIRLGVEAIETEQPAARPPHMMMSISSNLAFMHDLNPPECADNRQVGRRARAVGASSTSYDTTRLTPMLASPHRCRLDLVPPSEQLRRDVPAAPATPAFSEPILGQKRDVAQASVPAQPPRVAMSSAGRNLLAAVLRRVRAL